MNEKKKVMLINQIIELLDVFIFQMIDDESFRSLLVHFLIILEINEKMSWL